MATHHACVLNLLCCGLLLQTYEVMNEVVVDRGANPYLTKIECWEHGRLITKVCLLPDT